MAKKLRVYKDGEVYLDAEQLFRKELARGSINTSSTPHYDSFNEYKRMLKDTGFKVK